MTVCVLVDVSDTEDDALEATHDFPRVPCVGEFIEPAENWPGDYGVYAVKVTKVVWTPGAGSSEEAKALLEVELAKPSEGEG
jgi:hypothetical protein